MPLVISLLAGVFAAALTYHYMGVDRDFDNTSTVGKAAWAVTLGFVNALGVRLLIRLSPTFMMGALLGAAAAYPVTVLLAAMPGGGLGMYLGMIVLLTGVGIGLVVSSKYRLW